MRACGGVQQTATSPHVLRGELLESEEQPWKMAVGVLTRKGLNWVQKYLHSYGLG